MNEYKTIEDQTKKKLIDLNKTQAELCRALDISQALFWRYTHGRVKSMNPKKLADLINEGIGKL